MRPAIAVLCLLAGCSEQAPVATAPLGTQPPPRPEAAAPQASDSIVSPHVRRVEHGHASAASAPSARGGGGGGGGGGTPDEWRPRPEPPPTEREIAEYRERMRAEMAERPPEGDEQPCDRFLDVMRSNGEALERPGQDAPEGPTRAQMREHCRRLPAGFRDCLSPEYYGEHQAECQQEMDEMAARGRRRSNSAQREFQRVRAGQQPGRSGARSRPDSADEEEEEETGG